MHYHCASDPALCIKFASAKKQKQKKKQQTNKAEPILALSLPRGDVTGIPKQGCQWPKNRTCVCVRQIHFKKKRKEEKCNLS